MKETILVTYATRSGSTAGVAEAIARTFIENGISADVKPMADVDGLSGYAAVVAGSAIQGQKWLPEAMRFIRTNQAELRRKPFAAFMVCITLSMKGADQYRSGVAEWLSPVRALVRPVSEGLFAGALDFAKIPFSLNALLMRVPVMMGMWKTGDHRNWDDIRAWSKRTLPLLVR
jgi:menaquinone-dependent protoporphyrinogen oxidase